MPISGGSAIAPQDVWDILVASQTGVGSLGKLFADNLDLVLSEYMLSRGRIVSSDVVQVANDVEKPCASATYALAKEVLITLAGTLRTTYRNKAYGSSGEYIFSKIYINGGAVGIERTHQQGTYQQQPAENFTVAVDDLVQLYCKVSNVGFPGAVDEFRVKYDMSAFFARSTVE